MMARLFPRNQHTAERAVRVALGIVLLALVFIGPKTPWGLLGIIPLATGLSGSCPIYTILGFSTRRSLAK